jgi:tetratricopeptide (TPR) repeat protein
METPYGVWLDADDELLPGRVARMVEALQSRNADLASDEVELISGPTGVSLGILPIPAFLKERHPLARLFERNYLPGVGVPGFRTSVARQVGYDPTLHGAEDIDFVLRAVVAGARFCLLDTAGYRMHAYPLSLSRQIENQRGMYRKALRKHSYQDVESLYHLAGYDERITVWGLVSMAMFREDYDEAIQLVAQREKIMPDPSEVIETDGPWPFPERWLANFYRGTALLLAGRSDEALGHLESISNEVPSPALLNNLGVAKWRAGDRDPARRIFERSLQLFPGFMDARENLASTNPSHITSHPLRVDPTRADYAE